ncbi:flagellar regulatory protein FleQ [Vibrio maritimus]|uniref:Flagellar regulatory protein FleQ n=1 Tax=Vibrio maritimus TaxID=990268 RepID=A0A090T1X3_9VIBR|nr:flagellar regulatory protein FleQ [Vibrio maritimus]
MAQSKVLIVEDDEGLREALVDTLALAGYEWVEADCAEDALVKLKTQPVDIVVSDVQMAGMGGWRCFAISSSTGRIYLFF